jgi:hypothetical protein
MHLATLIGFTAVALAAPVADPDVVAEPQTGLTLTHVL